VIGVFLKPILGDLGKREAGNKGINRRGKIKKKRESKRNQEFDASVFPRHPRQRGGEVEERGRCVSGIEGPIDKQEVRRARKKGTSRNLGVTLGEHKDTKQRRRGSHKVVLGTRKKNGGLLTEPPLLGMVANGLTMKENLETGGNQKSTGGEGGGGGGGGGGEGIASGILQVWGKTKRLRVIVIRRVHPQGELGLNSAKAKKGGGHRWGGHSQESGSWDTLVCPEDKNAHTTECTTREPRPIFQELNVKSMGGGVKELLYGPVAGEDFHSHLLN